MFHWAAAENNFLKSANQRQKNNLDNWLPLITLIDFCKVFEEEPIIIKNMFKFKLKDVAGAMYENNLIKTRWEDINSGMTVIKEASKYYREKKNNIDIINNIINYNKTDCKVLWEIVDYLRNNHT